MKAILNLTKLFNSFIGVLSIIIVLSCRSEDKISAPTITTKEITSITKFSAIARGSIVSNYNDILIASGVCWNTKPSPTIANNIKTTENIISGNFSINLEGLLVGTTYYLRAFVTNSDGTYYGKEVAFTTLGSTEGEKIVFECYGNIYSINIDQSGFQQLTNDKYWDVINSDPSWFPDGKKIAYIKKIPYGNHGNIYVMNADGSNNIGITNETKSEISNIEVSPDGLKILYILDGNIFCIDTDGSKNVQLTNSTSNINRFELSWFPNNKQILYHIYTEDDDAFSLITLNLDGSNEHTIIKSFYPLNYPSVSSDGTKVIFQTYKPNSNLNLEFICSVNIDGSDFKTLFDVDNSGGFQVRMAYWSPDMQKIIFSINNDIYIVNNDGTEKKKIFSMTGYSVPIANINVY
jgi:hypothetical protein